MPPVENQGFVYNNLGMAYFYKFIALSNDVGDPKESGLDALKPVIGSFEEAIWNLKKSIRTFEQFDLRFKDLQDAASGKSQAEETQSDINLLMLKQKVFVEEFFSLDPRGQFLATDFKHYNLLNNAENEQFLKETFKVPATILPIQNIGEIAYIMRKMKDSFALLDASLKLYRHLDP